MSDAPPDTTPPVAGSSSAPSPRSRRLGWHWQIGLRGLILLVVVAALGLSIAVDRRQIADLTARIDRFQAVFGQLEVTNPTQFAVLRTNEHWMERSSWDVYLPPGHEYRLALATRAIDEDRAFPAPQGTGRLAPGRHRLTVTRTGRGTNYLLSVRAGDSPVLEVEEPPSSSPFQPLGSPLHRGKTIQQPISRPLQLVRRRLARAIPRPGGTGQSFQAPSGPANGVLLWVEALPEPGATPPAPAPGR